MKFKNILFLFALIAVTGCASADTPQSPSSNKEGLIRQHPPHFFSVDTLKKE